MEWIDVFDDLENTFRQEISAVFIDFWHHVFYLLVAMDGAKNDGIVPSETARFCKHRH
jgi:hypothetical protein